MTEEWRDVVGYETTHEVSNFGNVRRKKRSKFSNKRFGDNYNLKPMDNGMGYLRIKLTVNNKSKRVMLHRIIAEAWIDKPEGKNVINHINHIKTDNRIENLEWCTQSENCLKSVDNGTWGALSINRNKQKLKDGI